MWFSICGIRSRRFGEIRRLCGLCLPHYRELVQKVRAVLGYRYGAAVHGLRWPKKQQMLTALQEDIHKFTLKFDYRNKDMAWGTAKDAPQRVVKTLAGFWYRRERIRMRKLHNSLFCCWFAAC